MGTKEEDSVEDNEEIGSLNLVYGVGSENGALNTFATLEMHGVTNESFWLVAEMMNIVGCLKEVAMDVPKRPPKRKTPDGLQIESQESLIASLTAE